VNYQELGYALSKVSAQEAAGKAIAVLESIANIDGACLFYCIQASNILALAGLRSQSPYNEFHPDFSTEKQSLLEKALQEYGYEIMLEAHPYSDDSRRIFSINCVQAFRELPNSYKIEELKWIETKILNNFTDFILWSDSLQFSLVKLMEANKLPKDWLLDWWAPHNIRLGMLLGYPGQAISSFCWDEAHHAKGEPIQLESTPSLPFEGIYCGTHVSFDYTTGLKDDQAIVAHEKLWSKVLELVYKVFSEDRLLAIPEFKSEYDRFKIYDEVA
jgi:hypothetical protein